VLLIYTANFDHRTRVPCWVVFLDSYLLSLQKFNPRIFFLTGIGHIDGTGSSVSGASIELDMKRSIHSIGNHLRS